MTTSIVEHMKQITKLKIALTIAPSLFWMIVAVLYFTEGKGLSTSEVFQLVGWYYFLGILFEYPTGVIGDYYSHKLSVFLGYVICVIGLVWLLFAGGYWGVFIFYFLYALGASLIMGSDWALLHSVSDNFKNDLSDLKIWSGFMRALEMVAAGILTKIFGLEVAIYLTIIAFMIGGMLLLTISEPVVSTGKSKNRIPKKKHLINLIGSEVKAMWKLSWDGLKKVACSSKLAGVLFLGALTGAFAMLLKWLLNPFFLYLQIDLQWWGIIGGAGFLFVSLGTWLYKKDKIIVESSKGLLFLLMVFAGSIFFLGVKPVALLALAVFQISRGAIGTKLTVDLNKLIKDNERASIMSLKSVVRKVFISILSVVVGFLLGHFGFSVTVTVLAVVLLGGSLFILTLMND